MELWVRSQDKKILVKVINQIGLNYCDEKTIIANYKPDFIGTQGEYYEKIGSYKTKERALEVLDEIQDILTPIIITTNYECEIKDDALDKTHFNLEMNPQKTEIQEFSTYVYQMPEE